MATWHAIFDLASRPEYIQPLRDEIQRVIDEDGQDVDGEGFLKLKKTSLTKLRKLDSFMKESQRLSPPGFASMSRLTITPLQLSTGHTIPPNTRIAFPSFAISTSPASTTYSPSYNPPSNKPPTEFDGFRFYNLRNMEGKGNKVILPYSLQ
jgi:cytochrome P450